MNPTKLTDKRGNLRTINPTHNDTQRLTALIGRLELLTVTMPKARACVDDRIRDCVEAQGGQGSGSGHADTVARAAAQITVHEHQHRALGRALRSAEEAVDHLRLETERVLLSKSKVIEDHVRRCPVMVLMSQTVHLSNTDVTDEVLVRCDRLAAYRLDEKKNPIDLDPDDYCEQHRAEANEAARRAVDSNARRLRRHAS